MHLQWIFLLFQILQALSHPTMVPCSVPTAGVNYYTQCPYRTNAPYPPIIIKLEDKTSQPKDDVSRAGNNIESVLTSTKKKVSSGLLKSLLSLPEAVVDTVLGDSSD